VGSSSVSLTSSTGNCDKCGDLTPTIAPYRKNFTVVGLTDIQYPYDLPVPNVAYVAKGTTLSFKAIKSPAAAAWPDGKPVWAGTSGASGTGETTSVTFNTVSTSSSDYQTVTVECGNTLTRNVIVFDFVVTLTPLDDFGQRNQTKYGLEEVVSLAFTTTPAGLSVAQIGGLQWTKSGVGAISNAGENGTADYDAQETAGAVTFTLAITSGPSLFENRSYSRTIIAPSGEYMVKFSNVRHIINTCSAGFQAYIYLLPKDVSFANLEWREGSCAGAGNGFYGFMDEILHLTGDWALVNTSSGISLGCRIGANDTIYSGAQGPPYAPGDFNWPIPHEYKASDGVIHQVSIANHNQVADVVGKCTIQKEGAGPVSKNAGDDTSYY